MDNYKLKIKIGQHEFEAEGPSEIVESQFRAFKELIANPAMQTNSTSATTPIQEQNSPTTAAPTFLDKIMKVEGRVISLTVRATSEEDAILLIMLGQKSYRGNDGVTGSEIMDGLQMSGVRVPRADRHMEKLAEDNQVIKIGSHRPARYRLTNQGFGKAMELAQVAAATVTGF